MDYCQHCEKKEKVAALSCCGKTLCRRCLRECECHLDDQARAKKIAQAEKERLDNSIEEDQRLAAAIQLQEMGNNAAYGIPVL